MLTSGMSSTLRLTEASSGPLPWLCQVSCGVSTRSPGPKVMFSPSTPVKLVAPVNPKRIAFGECRCGGIISWGILIRYAANMVETVATTGFSAGFTMRMDRRSDSSIGINSAASNRHGRMFEYFQRCGIAGIRLARNRAVAWCSSAGSSPQNSNKCSRSVFSWSATRRCL